MPFELCNAAASFQCCMIAIFHELIEDSMEVFMDNFSVFGSSFNHYLKNLEKMLKRHQSRSSLIDDYHLKSCATQAIMMSGKYLDKGSTNISTNTLRQQNNERSTRELHNYQEGASGYCLCIRKILSIPGLIHDHRIHGSFCFAISIHKTNCKTTPNSMDLVAPRIDIEIRDKKGAETPDSKTPTLES
nr:RNA-directed DNA polymerase homolog [Tanacetum cinerariifolium]